MDDNFRPYQDIRITHTVILEDPFSDPNNFLLPRRSPSPTPQRLQNGRIAADEDIDDTDGKTVEELQEMLAEREAKARATILEIVGDLPDAEMAPPENVLFVCKLNPVTTDDDLEIIFSRFGKVKNCEVIRDKKTGDSLQYAFVEFEDQKSCEAAYFKMDNVLIDDRRIHVDFSQSVAKVKWRGKGRGVEGSLKRSEFDNLREPNQKRRTDDRDRKVADWEFSERNNSIDRRLAREERHRLQRVKEERQESSYRYERENNTYRRRRYNENIEREQGSSRDHSRRSPSRSGGRSKKYSPVRGRPDRYIESKAYRQRNEKPNQREYSDDKSMGKQLDRKRQNERKENGSRKPKVKSDRRRKENTSSSSDRDSLSNDSSSIDTGSSSDVSSNTSVDRKRQEQKNKIAKKRKTKNKTHKSKSRHRK